MPIALMGFIVMLVSIIGMCVLAALKRLSEGVGLALFLAGVAGFILIAVGSES